MANFERGKDFDIEWGGHYFKVDQMLGDLRVLVPHQGQLESEMQFANRFRQETNGGYDDPAAFAQRFHRDNPMATADNVRLAASVGMIETYQRYVKPIEKLEKYAASIAAAQIDPNQLVLGFRIKRVKAA
jgi:hypothetical protein